MYVSQLWEHMLPFRHYRATDFLPRRVYDSVAARFSEILEGNAGEHNSPYILVKTNLNYDARILAMDETLGSWFAPFFSLEFIRELYEVFNLPFLPIVDGGLHSSPIGSRTGWIHTDLCAAWFDESIRPAGQLLFPRRKRCDYFTGRKKSPSAKPRKYVRAAAMLFYLCNDGWTTDDGGETALYGTSNPSARSVIELVRPLSNSVLLFECSPHSYHRFITNPGRTRNSVILWIHATPQYVESRWGLSL